MKSTNKIKFFGDFTTGENYQSGYDVNLRINVLRQYGYDSLMEQVKGFFENSYNIVNLESPITNCTKSGLMGKKSVLHWTDPVVVPSFMKKYGIDAASLGNNHAWDYELEGLKQTIESLDNVDIKHFGAGIDVESAKAPLQQTFEIGSHKLNLYVFGGYKYKQEYVEEFDFYARKNKGGVFKLVPEDSCADIHLIKEEDPNAFIVMYPHFGFDLLNKAEHQVEYAKAWIDAGADMVIGHGPHLLNQIEYYKDKPIIYALGVFIFPVNFRYAVNEYCAVCEVEFVEDNGKLKPITRLYPLHFDNGSFTPVTRPVNDDEIEGFISTLTNDEPEIKNRIKVYKGCIYCIEL